MSRSVDFYFDFSSPNAYYGYVQLDRLEYDYEFEINLKPIFLGGLMKELDTTPPVMQNERKAEYLQIDIDRWGEFYEIPFTFPDDFPVDSLRAIRGVLALEEMDDVDLREYVMTVFEFAWAEGRDISDQEVLRSCLPGSVEPETFDERVESEEVKNKLQSRTQSALDRGVFGCPMFYVDDEPFWGKDRIQMVEARLADL